MHHFEDDQSAIEQTLARKKDLVRLFLIATVLGFGVGGLASLFAGQTIPASSIVATCGLVIAVSLLFLLRDLFAMLVFQDELDVVIFLDPTHNQLIPVEGYKFSELLYRTIRAVGTESKALHADWESDPLVPRRPDKPRPDVPANDQPKYVTIVRVNAEPEELRRPKSIRLLEEAAHFVLLEELSLHLSSYFRDHDDDALVRELVRDDIPEFLLRNRVLNLLCTPIEERDIFLKAFPDASKRPEGVICSLYGSDGSTFSRFDLVLPRGSSVHASGEGGITVETKRLSFTMKALYTGMSAVPRPSFVERYVKVPFNSTVCRQLIVTLTGRIKPVSLLTGSGWQYYRWLDSFRQKLRNTCDFETFQRSIQWRVVETFLHTFHKEAAGSQRVSGKPMASTAGSKLEPGSAGTAEALTTEGS